ncbi:20430_t:CDS:2 [Rhizophagus irregularis]|nr:20430_t:CDS:2 [Rhizophagus irregularis]
MLVDYFDSHILIFNTIKKNMNPWMNYLWTHKRRFLSPVYLQYSLERTPNSNPYSEYRSLMSLMIDSMASNHLLSQYHYFLMFQNLFLIKSNNTETSIESLKKMVKTNMHLERDRDLTEDKYLQVKTILQEHGIILIKEEISDTSFSSYDQILVEYVLQKHK